MIDVSGGPSASAYPVSYRSGVPAGGWSDEFKTTNIVLRRIPAGTFTMGAPESELGRDIDEIQHEVTLTRDFYVGVFQVTQKQWERVVGTWPSYFANVTYRETRPVERVSYLEIRENPANSSISPNWPQSDQVHADSFMGKLRAKTGLATLDLPTESQWEYACRAGTTTALNSGSNLLSQSTDTRMDEVGRYWFNGGSSVNSNSTPSTGTALVGSFRVNAWGLYDMHGNLWEWCLDWYDEYPGTVTNPPGPASASWRVTRGASFYAYAWNCRSARRMNSGAAGQASVTGFRIAMTVPPAPPSPAVDAIHSETCGPVTVDTLNEGGTLELSASHVDFTATYGGASPAPQALGLYNSGRVECHYSNAVTYGSDSGWFTLQPETGSLAGGAGHVLTGLVTSAGLTAGVYAATNAVSAPEATNAPVLLVAILTLGKAAQHIDFPVISDQVATGTVALTASASSGFPVAFSVDSGPAAIAGGTALSFTGAGTVRIRASQVGNLNWNPAATVRRTVTVKPAPGWVMGLLADFDGDGKADPTAYDSRTGTWKTKLSTGGYATLTFAGLLGGPDWLPAPADYDGDRLSDPAVYQYSAGNWKIMQSGLGYALLQQNAFLGGPGWVPAPADCDGDRRADYAVYRESDGSWNVKISSGGYALLTLSAFLGGPGWAAATTDYDGDGLADPTVYKRSDGTWKLLLSGSGYAPVSLPHLLGGSGWDPVLGDYDGDGLADPSVRKADGSEWRLRLSGTGYAVVDVRLGL